MNKYVEELVTELLFDCTDIASGQSFKDVGYDSKKDFFQETQRKLEELYHRLNNPKD